MLPGGPSFAHPRSEYPPRILLGPGAPGSDGGPDAPRVNGSVPVDAGERLYQIYDGRLGWTGGARIDALVIETRGSGSCTVDDVIADSPVC